MEFIENPTEIQIVLARKRIKTRIQILQLIKNSLIFQSFSHHLSVGACVRGCNLFLYYCCGEFVSTGTRGTSVADGVLHIDVICNCYPTTCQGRCQLQMTAENNGASLLVLCRPQPFLPFALSFGAEEGNHLIPANVSSSISASELFLSSQFPAFLCTVCHRRTLSKNANDLLLTLPSLTKPTNGIYL